MTGPGCCVDAPSDVCRPSLELCDVGCYTPGPSCRWLFLDIPGRTPMRDRFNVGCEP
jgi:hypothetical protein